MMTLDDHLDTMSLRTAYDAARGNHFKALDAAMSAQKAVCDCRGTLGRHWAHDLTPAEIARFREASRRLFGAEIEVVKTRMLMRRAQAALDGALS